MKKLTSISRVQSGVSTLTHIPASAVQLKFLVGNRDQTLVLCLEKFTYASSDKIYSYFKVPKNTKSSYLKKIQSEILRTSQIPDSVHNVFLLLFYIRFWSLLHILIQFPCQQGSIWHVQGGMFLTTPTLGVTDPGVQHFALASSFAVRIYYTLTTNIYNIYNIPTID